MTATALIRPLRHWVSRTGERALRVASRAYVPGETLDEALGLVARLQRQDIACTLGYFNSEDERAADIVRRNGLAIEALSRLARPAYLSIKVPPIGYDATHLDRLARLATTHGQRLHFDSHGPETADPTLAAVARLQAQGHALGLTLPARWQRSDADADWARAHGIRVRIVKGQWACPERPDADLRERFLAIVDRLAGQPGEVAIATHDTPLAREAITRLHRHGTPCELELLCGLPRRASLALARELAVPVRMYIPFGQAWLPYAFGQAMRNPRMFTWMVRDTLSVLAGR